MEERIALVGIIVENLNSAESLNAILHQYRRYIIGRMGVPFREKKVSIISVALCAPADVISAMSGKLGRLSGVSTKTVYAKYGAQGENENRGPDSPRKAEET